MEREEDPVACTSLAGETLRDCLDECPSGLGCREVCQLEAVEVHQACRDQGGTQHDCALVTDDALWSCLQGCGVGPPCEILCDEQAEQVFQTCTDSGGHPHECEAEADGMLWDCLVADCDADPPHVPCELACHPPAKQALHQCIMAGRTLAQCQTVFDGVLWACLVEECGWEPPELTCEAECFGQADEVFSLCMDEGQPPVCVRRADRALRDCLEAQCGVAPTCEDECIVGADELFFECLDEGSPPPVCLPHIDQFLGPCFEACDAHTASADRRGDAAARPMDPGAGTPFDPDAHRLIDLLHIRVGQWAPDEPHEDLFTGRLTPNGEFFRMDLTLDGCVNPPGSVTPETFSPFTFGPHPVYGFVEIDIDANRWTGGETDSPRYRYLGNIVRFGGMVLQPGRRWAVAPSGGAFDHAFGTPPFVERHGEEFHLALLGGQFGYGDIEEREGDGDGTFEPAETWDIRAPLFHRAHGYEPFSFALGGAHAGEYAPVVDLRFRHDPAGDVTVLTLVVPLTDVGAGLMRNQPPQPYNGDPSDHASVLEALWDLHDSAAFLQVFPSGLPEEAMIADWASQYPPDHDHPAQWELTALLGTSYTRPHPTGTFYVWTDAYPNVVPGDVDGSGEAAAFDAQLVAEYVLENDGQDGVADGVVTLAQFARDFSVFDVNHDGVVDEVDATVANARARGDGDRDGDRDLSDVAIIQRCFAERAPLSPPCALVDFDLSGRIDWNDASMLADSLDGPGEP